MTSDDSFELESTLQRDSGVRGRGPLVLLVHAASGSRVFPLRPVQHSFVIGRDPTSDIPVKDGTVSRRHAVLRTDEMTLEDLDSSNGSTVTGIKLTPGERMSVRVGGSFELGSVTFVLRNDEAPALGATSAHSSRVIAVDPKMRELYRMIDFMGPTNLAVLILGETGVGKEVYAEEVHRRSKRAAEPFLKLNCAAFAESLLEAELFGFEKGAFTGAVQSKGGLFEAAHTGTILLDEVGDLSLTMQAKLLRVLESGEVMRLGSVKTRTVDVRFISATNYDLKRLVAANRFRSDLYYRLAGTTVTLPPLRARRLDIEPIARALLQRAGRALGKNDLELSPAALEILTAYEWPGNVRELRNTMDRAAAWCERTVEASDVRIEPDVLGETGEVDGAPSEAPPSTSTAAFTIIPPPAGAPSELRDEMRTLEKTRILAALAETAGNQSQAAKLLGISRHTLMSRLEEYGVSRPRKKR